MIISKNLMNQKDALSGFFRRLREPAGVAIQYFWVKNKDKNMNCRVALFRLN